MGLTFLMNTTGRSSPTAKLMYKKADDGATGLRLDLPQGGLLADAMLFWQAFSCVVWQVPQRARGLG